MSKKKLEAGEKLTSAIVRMQKLAKTDPTAQAVLNNIILNVFGSGKPTRRKRNMPKQQRKKPLNFHTLSVPQFDWFQTLLRKQAAKGSLSCQLLHLIMRDLRSRKVLTEKQYDAYQAYKRRDIRSTRFTKKVHYTFSLYLPSGEQETWIREYLNADFLREKCGVKSRSFYVWQLFVQEHSGQLSQSQIAEWSCELQKAAEQKAA